MSGERIWVSGATRSGKTTFLVDQFRRWMQPGTKGFGGIASVTDEIAISGEGGNRFVSAASASRSIVRPLAAGELAPGVLVLAAIGDHRIDLLDQLTAATKGRVSLRSTTPLGFFQEEVMLFWSLLIQQLDLKAQFPVRLAPENEQELATQLWQSALDRAIGQQTLIAEGRLVRRLLDVLQLASLAGIPLADVPVILNQGLSGQVDALPVPDAEVGDLLQHWQQWCLERGLLTYGIIAGLYWQYLLPNPTYQQQLAQRYQLVLADDVDEYPAIARTLFETLLDAGASAIFTYNPDGAVRLGLGADPAYLAGLADRCRVETLTERPVVCLGDTLADSIVALVTDPIYFATLPTAIQTLQTTSRAQLLGRMADVMIEAVQKQQVQPRDIAVIAPGMDAIARYSLTEMLAKHQILVETLNDQRPLISSPVIRALLTLLTLVYAGLGRLVDREAVAEMLVVLSQGAGARSQEPGVGSRESEINQESLSSFIPYPSSFVIDPVRAGLLADYCFVPHPDRPRLLPATTFPRWDRLGYQASAAYQAIVEWIDTQQNQLAQRLIPNAVSLLDRAIQHFLFGGGSLPFEQVSALRQLIEAAQHYWEVDGRLRHRQRFDAPASMTVSRFIQLLQSGTVTANPYPVRPIGPASNAVLLTNVFQYRSSRRAHRWQFWLDAGSPRWLSGVDALFAAPLFLQGWSGRAWTSADTMEANERRLRRILHDLLGRAGDRLYLCHSDLATNGQEQTGILLSLVNAATPIDAV